MTVWQQKEVGVEAVTLLDVADEKVDLIVSYWQNAVSVEGNLVFPGPIKGILELANGVATDWRSSSTTTAGRPEFLWTSRRRSSVSRDWKVRANPLHRPAGR